MADDPKPTFKAVAPAEAIAHFRDKVSAETFDYRDLEAKVHARVFTVAKSAGYDVLEDIREAVDRALSEGRTLQQFSAELRPVLEAKGWWGKQAAVDPQTGESRTVQLGSPRRLRTIFTTNLRTAYAAGQWERIQQVKGVFPFLRYNHTPQEHPRLEHQAWGDAPTILEVDDPWWHTHFPPNGFNCKCFVTQYDGDMLKARGLKQTRKPIVFPPKAYRNPRTGETAVIEGGIDPSFNSNPGRKPLEPLTPRPLTPQAGPGLESPQPAPAAEGAAAPSWSTLPIAAGAQVLERNLVQAEAEAAFLGTFDLAPDESKVFIDAGGAPFVVGPALFQRQDGRRLALTSAQRQALPVVAQAILAPAQILWIWRKGERDRQLLMRRYVGRYFVDGQVVDVVVDQSTGASAPAWTFATSLDQGWADRDATLRGYIAWRQSGN